MQARTLLATVDKQIKSSYDALGRTGNKDRAALQPLYQRSSGRMTPDAAQALLKLHFAVSEAGGDFRVTDCLRSVAEQTVARAKYERWLESGSPKDYDHAIMRSVFVARPGRSFHNAGRAIDVDLKALQFAGVAADQVLDTLWEIARPLGWSPIIKAPNERADESWHFDYLGEWGPVYARVGYEQAAMCAVLDIGEDTPFLLARERSIQANLHRAGYNIGDIDGILGRRTIRALTAAGIHSATRAVQFAYAMNLPSSNVQLAA